jgi:hypothetical protein
MADLAEPYHTGWHREDDPVLISAVENLTDCRVGVYYRHDKEGVHGL